MRDPMWLVLLASVDKEMLSGASLCEGRSGLTRVTSRVVLGATDEIGPGEGAGPGGVVVKGAGPGGVVSEGAGPGGVVSEGAGPGGVASEGAGSEDVVSARAGPRGVVSEDTDPGGVVVEGAGPEGVVSEGASPGGVVNEDTDPGGVVNEGAGPEGVVVKQAGVVRDLFAGAVAACEGGGQYGLGFTGTALWSAPAIASTGVGGWECASGDDDCWIALEHGPSPALLEPS